MSRQIVVCLDGTWNNPGEQTNVYRLFGLLPGEEQRVEESGPIRSYLVRRSDEVLGYYLLGKKPKAPALPDEAAVEGDEE